MKQHRGRGAGVKPVPEEKPDVQVEINERERARANYEATNAMFGIALDECDPSLCAGTCKGCEFERGRG